MSSKSMMLVCDDVDDDYPVDGVADDSPNDRTHKIQLGGDFRIESFKSGTGQWQPTSVTARAPIEKTVALNVIVFREKSAASGGSLAIPLSTVEQHLKMARDRYAQTGIRLTWSPVTEPSTQTSVNFLDGLTARNQDPNFSEEKTLIDEFGTYIETDVNVFYVNSFTNRETLYGEALLKFPPPLNIYNNNLFLAGGLAQESGKPGPVILPHELGHILANYGHDTDPTHIMAAGKLYRYDQKISDSKRFTEGQSNIMKNNSIAK